MIVQNLVYSFLYKQVRAWSCSRSRPFFTAPPPAKRPASAPQHFPLQTSPTETAHSQQWQQLLLKPQVFISSITSNQHSYSSRIQITGEFFSWNFSFHLIFLYLCESGSILRIRIHKVAKYWFNLDPDPQINALKSNGLVNFWLERSSWWQFWPWVCGNRHGCCPDGGHNIGSSVVDPELLPGYGSRIIVPDPDPAKIERAYK